MRRTVRSFSASQADAVAKEVGDFHRQVRMWLAEVPIGSPIYVGLSILNGTLETVTNTARGDADALRYQNVNAGGSWKDQEG